MTDYYGYHHRSSPYVSGHYRDNMEYRGYDDAWVIGRERRPSYGPRASAHRYGSGYGHDAYDYGRSRSRSRSHHYAYGDGLRYGRSDYARLAWPTEVPIKLRVSLCCDDCRWRLDEALRYIQGVYDVGISGRSNAFVTVTGTGDNHKILETARQFSNSADLWSESSLKSWY